MSLTPTQEASPSGVSRLGTLTVDIDAGIGKSGLYKTIKSH